MTELTAQMALRQLHSDRLAPIYLVYGEAQFFVSKILDWFLENAISAESRDFNYNRFAGEKASLSEIIYAAKSVSMMGGRKLIVVEEADLIEDSEGQLLSYLAAPVQMTTLILVAKKPDMRTKFFAALKKQAVFIHCKALYENEIPGFIRSTGEQLGITLSNDAVLFLVEHLGKDLTLLHAELEKLSLHAGKQNEKSVSLETAKHVVSGEKAQTVFDLINAIFEKDLKNALSRLAFMLDNGEAPLKILAMLLWQFRMMAIGKETLLSESEAACGKKLSLPPFRVGLFLERLRLWQAFEIQTAFLLFKEADLQLKGSRLAPAIILEDLIFKICRRRAPLLRKEG
ncbi:MAG: DNA polymerase III subunit delta [Nitrospirota bacterium]